MPGAEIRTVFCRRLVGGQVLGVRFLDIILAVE